MTEKTDSKPETSEDADAEDVAQALGDVDLRALDAQYEPIAPFKEWADLLVDDAIWNSQLKLLKQRAAHLAPEDLERARTVAIRAAAVDSGAIEGLYETDRGLTYTIAVQEAAWQAAMRSHDERMPDFFEAQLAAYALASEIAASQEPVTEVWIRQLHDIVCRPQAEYKMLTPQGWAMSPLPKGEYKRQPNHVKQADDSTHAYAPVDMTSAEMHHLVEELKSGEFGAAHPVLQAAYVHYGLVAIHPFADGNGRVARAVASVYLRRQSRIPLLIWADQRTQYFDALEAADKGDRQTFVDFVFDRAIDALTFVANELGPRPEDRVADLSKLYVSYGGHTFQQLDEMGARIMQHVLSASNEVKGTLQLPREIRIQTSLNDDSSYQVDDPTYRRPLQGLTSVRVHLSTAAPAMAANEFGYHILVAQEVGARYAFRVECTDPAGGFVDVRLHDVDPELSETFRRQIFPWIRRTIAEGLGRLNTMAEEVRQSHRYP